MKRIWKWAKRAAVATLVIATAAAANWKQLLIAWHWREYQKAVTGEIPCVADGLERVDLDLWPEPLLFAYTQRFLGFPGDEYFSGFGRPCCHWEQLRALGYVEQREFPAGEWVDLCQFKNLADYPFRSNLLTAFEEGLGGMARPVRGAEATVDPRTGQKFLCVRDQKDRMPLWEAFVARHNAEQPPAELPMPPIPARAGNGGRGK
jgi:hypothetical protein